MSTTFPRPTLLYSDLSEWSELHARFLKTHGNIINVLIHLLATPLGIIGILALASLVSPLVSVGISCFYLGTLVFRVPSYLWISTALLISLLLIAVFSSTISLSFSIAAIASGYLLQEISHRWTGEPSMQSTYMADRDWIKKLSIQTYYLVPLILAAFFRVQSSVLGFIAPRTKVLKTVLRSDSSVQDLETLVEYIEALNPPREHTFHRWQNELEPRIEAAFSQIANADEIMEMFRQMHGKSCVIEVLVEMNELYVTAPMKKLSSDSVFKTPHIDGPWAIFPFAAVYRCMAAASENKRVTTHFPMNGESYTQPLSYVIDKGEVVAFDYNREPHYITINTDLPETNRRINLKLHYLVYPRWLHPIGRVLGRLSVRYNDQARKLFLNTLRPDSFSARMNARMILISTLAFEKTERFIGFGNLTYTLACLILSIAIGSILPFLAGMSFIHYLFYIGTFARREGVSFGKFKRNVIYYKSIAILLLLCLAYQYPPDFFGAILILGGFTIAGLASLRLGVNRTYFSAELGWSSKDTFEKFPYGVIPHPMTIGSIIGLVGFYTIAPLRVAFPWLIPIHIAFYVFHLAQECGETQLKVEGECLNSPST